MKKGCRKLAFTAALLGALKLRLNSLVVVAVGAGGILAKDLALGDFTDEEHMAAQILLTHYLAGEHSVHPLGQIGKTVVAPFKAYEVCKLVNLSAGLHTEVANGLEGDIFRQHADIENAAFFDEFPGQVALLDGNGQPDRIICHLDAGVGHAAVIPAALGGDDKQTIGQIEQGLRVCSGFLPLSESSGSAGPPEPCRGEPRHEPSRGRCRGWRPGCTSWPS